MRERDDAETPGGTSTNGTATNRVPGECEDSRETGCISANGATAGARGECESSGAATGVSSFTGAATGRAPDAGAGPGAATGDTGTPVVGATAGLTSGDCDDPGAEECAWGLGECDDSGATACACLPASGAVTTGAPGERGSGATGCARSARGGGFTRAESPVPASTGNVRIAGREGVDAGNASTTYAPSATRASADRGPCDTGVAATRSAGDAGRP